MLVWNALKRNAIVVAQASLASQPQQPSAHHDRRYDPARRLVQVAVQHSIPSDGQLIVPLRPQRVPWNLLSRLDDAHEISDALYSHGQPMSEGGSRFSHASLAGRQNRRPPTRNSAAPADNGASAITLQGPGKALVGVRRVLRGAGCREVANETSQRPWKPSAG